jgi:hypothetical protein
MNNNDITKRISMLFLLELTYILETNYVVDEGRAL